MAFSLGTLLNVIAVLVLPRADPSTGLLRMRALSALLSTAALTLPFMMGNAPPFFRAVVAQALMIETWRVAEVMRQPVKYPPRERVLRVLLLPFEYTFLTRTAPRVPLRELAFSTLLLGIGITLFVIGSRFGPSVAPYQAEGWPRWLGATVGAYILMEGMTMQWVSVLPIFGFSHRPYQRHPILSRSIAEFWGVRWSSVVHRYLRSNVYEPLARRRMPRAGVVAAFFVSATIHGYLVWPAAGWIPAMWMLAFFLVHGLAMIAEATLRVRRWPSLAARAFVIGVFVLTVPLFMEPILRTVGL